MSSGNSIDDPAAGEGVLSDLNWVARLRGAEHLLERIAGIEAILSRARTLREHHHLRGPEMVSRLCAEALHLEAQAEHLAKTLYEEISAAWSAEEIAAARAEQPA